MQETRRSQPLPNLFSSNNLVSIFVTFKNQVVNEVIKWLFEGVISSWIIKITTWDLELRDFDYNMRFRNHKLSGLRMFVRRQTHLAWFEVKLMYLRCPLPERHSAVLWDNIRSICCSWQMKGGWHHQMALFCVCTSNEKWKLELHFSYFGLFLFGFFFSKTTTLTQSRPWFLSSFSVLLIDLVGVGEAGEQLLFPCYL